VSPQPETKQVRQTEDDESGDEGGESEGDADSGRAAETAAPKWVAPIGSTRSTWSIEYADVREDRVVLYGRVGAEAKEFIYRIKATNVGTYIVPPTFGEAMYDRSVQARSLASSITVERN
jgi:uncharacterized protein YfaS (alpha-2-macroglobulin family)